MRHRTWIVAVTLAIGALAGRWEHPGWGRDAPDSARAAAPVAASVAAARHGAARGADRASDRSPDHRPAEPTFEDALEQLQSPRWKQRDAAMAFLLREPASRLPRIEERIARETNPEVFARLTRVATHLFLKGRTSLEGKSGILGIALSVETVRLAPGDLRTAVVVQDLQPGFPAAERLESGDRLVGADGEAFPVGMSPEDFRQFISGQPAGTVVRFSVLRAGRLMQIKVPLAGMKDEAMLLADYIQDRSVRAAAYAESRRASRKASPLAIPDPEATAAPARVEPGVIIIRPRAVPRPLPAEE